MKKTLLALAATQFLVAHSNLNDPIPSLKEELFFEIGVGKGTIDIEDNTFNYSLTSGALENKPFVLDFGVGYGLNEDFTIGAHYQNNSLEIGDVENIYISLDYNFHLEALHYSKYESLSLFKPFVGVVLGSSTLNWDEAPIEGAAASSSSSSSFYYGFEAGLNRPISEQIFVSFKYQFNDIEHKTIIGNETIYHKNQNNFLFSVNWKGDFL